MDIAISQHKNYFVFWIHQYHSRQLCMLSKPHSAHTHFPLHHAQFLMYLGYTFIIINTIMNKLHIFKIVNQSAVLYGSHKIQTFTLHWNSIYTQYVIHNTHTLIIFKQHYIKLLINKINSHVSKIKYALFFQFAYHKICYVFIFNSWGFLIPPSQIHEV